MTRCVQAAVRMIRGAPVTAMLSIVVVTQTVIILGFAIVLADIRTEVTEDLAVIQQQGEESQVRGGERLQQAMMCLLAQQHDHRDNSKDALEHLFRLHGFEPPPPPAPPALDALPSGVEACRAFAVEDP